MRTDRELKKYLKERSWAIARLDMQYARQAMPDASSDSVRLMALHKARYEAIDIARELRHASGLWLRERGLGRFGGLQLLPEGQLPGDEDARHG